MECYERFIGVHAVSALRLFSIRRPPGSILVALNYYMLRLPSLKQAPQCTPSSKFLSRHTLYRMYAGFHKHLVPMQGN